MLPALALPGIGNAIGAGASLIGGLIGQNNASSQFWQQVKMANRQFKRQQKWNVRNYKFARQQAHRQTIAYRVQDAKRAGVHPLYALGANLGSVAGPSISVGGSLPSPTGDGGLASGIAQMGQHLGRAVEAGATAEQRLEARMLSALNIENAGLQNELLRSQIRRLDASSAPAMPGGKGTYVIDGQGNTVNITPKEIETAMMTQKLPEPGQNVKLGKTWQANPYISNAEDIENRYGEIADALWGAAAIPADIYWNASRSNVGQKIWSLLGYDNFNSRFHFNNGRR